MQLYDFQKKGLEETKNLSKVAYYWSMGTGKSFVGGEKLMSFDTPLNLVVCQKSKIDDWVKHFEINYKNVKVFNLTKNDAYRAFLEIPSYGKSKLIGVINYDLIFRRKELTSLKGFSVIYDESSMLKNEKAKRTKTALRFKADNVILLSGTPVGGKYEELWSQCKLLGWEISKTAFWNRYINYREWSPFMGHPIKIVTGYKNEEDLKFNLKLHGANFLRSEDVLTLPEQVFQTITVNAPKGYKQFMKNGIVTIGENELVGDTPLTKLLHARQLCGIYSAEKLAAVEDWINSNNERLIIFYNFKAELEALKSMIGKTRPLSVINGRDKDLSAYENYSNSITLCQYQAASMGLNLQKARYLAYYSLTLSSELYEQSKKRIHRIGQKNTCFYYLFICKDTIEEGLLETLNKRNDYTLNLFKQEFEHGRFN